MIETLKNLIPEKSYNKFGIIVLTLFTLFGVTLIGIVADLSARTNLNCKEDKNVLADLTQTYIEAKCLLNYEKKFNSPIPLYGLVIINFGTLLILCLIYALKVEPRFGNPVSTTSESDEAETQPLQPERSQSQQEDGTKTSIPVFYFYILHLLFFRFLFMILFASLVFLPVDFPSEFICPLPLSSNIRDPASVVNVTHVFCTNAVASKNTLSAKIVAIGDIAFATLALAETVYLLWQKWHDKHFSSDLEFDRVYLRGKRTMRQIISRYKQALRESQVFKINLRYGRTKEFEDIFVNLIMQNERQRIQRSPQMERHETYDTYLDCPEHSFKEIGDLFRGYDAAARSPRKILVVGRPGIGKSVLSRKIIRDWSKSSQVHEFYNGKVVILLQFRLLNLMKVPVTLKDVLKKGTAAPVEDDFDALYEYIRTYPERAILIFDGLDELQHDSASSTEEEVTENYYDCHMPTYSVFKKLICGKFLPGATVLTTSRPTAESVYSELPFDRRAEILGFTRSQIKEFVEKFCSDGGKSAQSDLGERMWSYIENSAELLSVCYIPVSCYIVCLTLRRWLEYQADKKDIRLTLTNLYQVAIRIILWDHHSRCKNERKDNDYFYSDKYFPKEVKASLNVLSELAKDGMEQGKLIFGRKELASTELSSCGLINRLPDDAHESQYSFLHLTIQEFLAARHFVENMDNDSGKVKCDIETWVSNPSWHLVLQFFAGLLGDKMKENEKDEKKRKAFKDVCSSFTEWIPSSLTTSMEDKEKRNALLKIRCLYELQDDEMMRSAAENIDGGGDSGCHMVNWGIGPVDCTAIFHFLIHVKKLVYLNIADNHIAGDGCLELAKFLMRPGNSLTTLKLGHNRIKGLGVKYLCGALKNEHCKLTSLELSYINNSEIMGEVVEELEGSEHLCNAVKNENCKLTHLDLSLSLIGEESAKHFQDAVQNENCQLNHLGLRVSHIEKKVVIEQLSNALSLTSLSRANYNRQLTWSLGWSS